MGRGAPETTRVIHPATAVGAVRLAVADAGRARDFYERAVGLRRLDGAGEAIALGAPGGPALVELLPRPDAPGRPRGASGLFHMALLVPSRAELARALRRVLDAGWSFVGASDHLVSEALYLQDPEGNGIEIYRDRPRAEWPVGEDGDLRMDTLPLDVAGVLAELPGDPDPGMPGGTSMGHVHLQVHDLGAAERFYAGALGLGVTTRGYPGALFLAAGGYHHHVGLNTWGVRPGVVPPPGALGLVRAEILVPDGAEARRVAERLAAAGVDLRAEPEGVEAADPAGNRVLVRAAEVAPA